jgi:cell division protein FtsI (penicillin-binding protein 3)/stage V sporulation protein D (sporulation-specific penicillin-binding protein)
MTGVLEKSINTGAVYVEQTLPHDTFLNYIKKLGIFEKTGVDITEVYSQNSSLKNGKDINYATASFGQGIEMTPLQLVRAFCAIANGGKLVRPYLVEKVIQEGKTTITEPEISSETIFSSETISDLKTMLVSVVEKGYGKAAKISGYYVGGKTGTAQVAENGQYSSDKTIQSFIGFAPVFDPKFVILVKLDNPQSATAEYSATPVFTTWQNT